MCCTVLAEAQDAFTDSLKTALEQAETDVQRFKLLVNLSKSSQDRDVALAYAQQALPLATTVEDRSQALNQIAWSFKNLFSYDSARLYAGKAIEEAKATKDPLVLSDVYNTLGSIFNNQNDYDSALQFHRLALQARTEAKDDEARAISMNNLSLVFQRLGTYDSAAFYIDQSIAIYEATGQERRAADSWLNKGNLYTNAGELDKAYESFQGALRTYEKLELSVMMTYALINMGTVAMELGKFDQAAQGLKRSLDILNANDKNARLLAFTYIGLGDVYKAKEEPDSAIYFFKAGGEQAELAGSDFLLSASYNNLGQLLAEKGEYRKAMPYLKDALRLKEAMGEQSGMVSVKVALGKVYAETRNDVLASKHLTEALAMAMELGDMTEKEAALEASYNFAKSRGRFREALGYLERMEEVKDSLLNADHLNTVEELNIQYETEKKEQTLAIQDLQLSEQSAKLERNQVLIIGLIVVALLVVIIAMLLRIRSRKEKALLLKETDLKLREAEINAVINSQEKERNRFARDLHDGFGQMISVLKMSLSQLGNGASKTPEKQVQVFEQSERVIGEMYEELRNICFDLMPQTLIKHGLGPALKEFGSRVTATGKVVLEVLVFDMEERLPEKDEVSLYRISQEWVNNVLKYAGADHITLQLTRDEEEITLTIEDNGQGFDPQTFYQGTGNGWRNMQSRLNLIGGAFELESRPGRRGTMAIVNLGVKSAQEIPASTDVQISQ